MLDLQNLQNFLKIHAILNNSKEVPNLDNIPKINSKSFPDVYTYKLLPFYLNSKDTVPLPYFDIEKMVTSYDSEMSCIDVSFNYESQIITLKENDEMFLLDSLIRPVLQFLSSKNYEILLPKEDLEIAAAFMKCFFNEDIIDFEQNQEDEIKYIEPNPKILKLLSIKTIYNLYSMDLEYLKLALNGDFKNINIMINGPYIKIEGDTSEGYFDFDMHYISNLDLEILSEIFDVEFPKVEDLKGVSVFSLEDVVNIDV